MDTEIIFVVSESMKDVARSIGIPTARGGRVEYMPCPFAVGDFISYPAASALAFRVTWRLYSAESESKPTRWILGLEKAVHPLEDQAPGEPRNSKHADDHAASWALRFTFTLGRQRCTTFFLLRFL